jgi:glycosyltransferase involved in cell wall biosynthesis
MGPGRLSPLVGAAEDGMKILSFCCVFPNPCEPGCGPFSRSRLQALAETDEVIVIAPIAPFDYDNPNRRGLGRRSVPVQRRDDKLTVRHPAWVYFPRNVALNGLCLAVSLLWPIWRLRRKFRFQLIDAHFGHPEGVAAWLLAQFFRCPYLVRLHGNELVNSRYRLRRALIARALRGAARLVAVSDELRGLAISLGADPDKTKVIANGVDSGVHYPRERTRLRQALGLVDDRPVILSAGRLVEFKGHQHAIGAVRVLRDQGMNVELAIAGGTGRGLPSYEQDLRKLVFRYRLEDSVRFLGWIPPENLAEWMCAADVLCLASRREGCPNVVIEALACGTPIVATDVGMVRKLIPSERYGFVVPPENADSLADALQRALQKQWERAAISRWGQARTWADAAREVRAEILAAIDHEQDSEGASEAGSVCPPERRPT